jgi:hypothetical protein
VRRYDAAGNESWTRQFSPVETNGTDEALGAAADNSGVYVVGDTAAELAGQTSAGQADAFVRKYDPAGNELWTRQFGTAAPEIANGVAVGASGVYVAGFIEGGAFPGQTNAGGQSDVFVRQYDAAGNELWTRQFGSAGEDHAFGVAADASGVAIAGSTNGPLPGGGGGDFGTASFVRKYDAAGTELWTDQFGTATDHPADAARAVAADGNVYVAGDVAGALPGQTTTAFNDVFVRKYDGAGNELWTREFGTAALEQALAVAVDASGVYVAGYTDGTLPGQTSAGGPDAFVRKYDLAGNELWTRQFGTSGADSAVGIAADASGVYVTGSTTGTFAGQTGAGDEDAFVRKFDADGSELWTRQFGSSGWDQATGVAAVGSGIYVSGFTAGVLAGQAGAGEQDGFVCKYDTAGNMAWTRQFGTGSADQAAGVAVDASGVYVAGRTAGTLPGLTGAGLSDVFVRKYDLGGTEVWTRQFGTAAADQALGVAVGPSGVYLAGSTEGTLPGQASAGFGDAFVRKYGAAGNLLWTGQFGTAATDSAAGVAVGAAGLFVAGSTTGTFPNQSSADGQDAFVARIVDSVGPAPTVTVVSVSAPTPLFGVDGVTLTAAVSVIAPGTGTPTGTVTFSDGGSVLGTADLVNGVASLALGNTALAAGPHTLRAAYGGDGNFLASESAAVVTVLAPSTVQGLVFVDFNDDGQVDFGERAVAGVTVTLTGTDDLGHAASRIVPTDANGVYAVPNLRPSDAAGYIVAETQPAGLPDGRDTPGTVDGVPTGSTAANDTFSGVILPNGGSFGENYNFGERPAATGGFAAGQTATIGFWQNRNGQALVQSLNGGPTATQLGHWLAATFPDLYGPLDGLTNAQVGAYYKALFARTAPAGPPKVDAQVMATALAVFVTNQTLAGTTAAAYGFQVTADGVGTRTVNVAGNGAAFGVANNSTHSVLDLLLAADARSHAGLLCDADANGLIGATETGYRTQVNDVFTAINETGDV